MYPRTLLVFLVLLASLACSSSAGRRDASYAKAEAFLRKGDYANAEFHISAAIQADPACARSYELLGRIQFSQQRLQEAATSLQKAVRIDPGLTESHRMLGEMYLLAGKIAAASKEADLALAKGATIPSLMLKAAISRAGGRLDEAVGWCDKATAQDPRRPEPYLIGAQLRMQKGRADEARMILEAGSGRVAEPMPLQISLAQVYLAEKKPALAGKIITSLVERRPKDPKLRLVLAEYYIRQGKAKEAEAELRRAVGLGQNDEGLRAALVDFLLGTGQADKAEVEIKVALRTISPGYALRARLVQLYQMTNRVDEAINACRSAVALDPGRPEALVMQRQLAALYMEQQRADEALVELDAVLRSRPQDQGAALLKGKALLSKGDVAAAVAVLKGMLAADPGAVEPNTLLARAYAAMGQPDMAKQTLQQALRTRPEAGELRQALARLYMAEGNSKAAVAEYEAALRRNPADTAALTDLGALHVAEGEVNQAEHCFKKLVRLRPDSHVGYYRLGLLALYRKKIDDAAGYLSHACKLAPDFAPAAEALVKVYLTMEEPTKAVAFLQDSIKARPQDPVLHNMAGDLFMLLNDLSKAQDEFNEAQRIAPDWRVPYDNLTVLYMRTNQPDIIMTRLAEVFQRTRSVPVGFMLGMLQEMREDYRAARATYEKVLKERPDSALAASNLAFLLVECFPGKETSLKAEDLARKVLSKSPQDPFVQDTIGWVAYRRGDVAMARWFIGSALDGQPGSPVINYHMGMVCAKEGKNNSARRHLRQALDSGKEFLGIKDARKVLKGLP
ncbi:MAG: tetratricopeptide repeat protein [Pseudomonadota bacterium]